MKIAKDFYFEAAHYIPNHKTCGRMHGHSYKLRVICEGIVKSDGMVMDFKELKSIVQKEVIDIVDHQVLNDIAGLELPTAENILFWIQNRLVGKISLSVLRLWETKDSYAELKY